MTICVRITYKVPSYCTGTLLALMRRKYRNICRTSHRRTSQGIKRRPSHRPRIPKRNRRCGEPHRYSKVEEHHPGGRDALVARHRAVALNINSAATREIPGSEKLFRVGVAKKSGRDVKHARVGISGYWMPFRCSRLSKSGMQRRCHSEG